MRIKTHLDNTLYLSSLWSDLSKWGHFFIVLNLRNPNLRSSLSQIWAVELFQSLSLQSLSWFSMFVCQTGCAVLGGLERPEIKICLVFKNANSTFYIFPSTAVTHNETFMRTYLSEIGYQYYSLNYEWHYYWCFRIFERRSHIKKKGFLLSSGKF